MQSLTYKDIIDDKIAEWQDKLKQLDLQAENASSDSVVRSRSKMESLKTAIESAVAQLHTLDAQETVDNTMETKDKIVKIFSSIDKDFIEFEDKTPFML